jgi:hypothetical protein
MSSLPVATSTAPALCSRRQCLESSLRLKARLLCEGVAIRVPFAMPEGVHRKSVHLYAHSPQVPDHAIPEDVLLGPPGQELIARIRVNNRSRLSLTMDTDGPAILDERGDATRVNLAPAPRFADDTSITQVCSYLGTDLLGVTPLNYCDYYRNGNECRFCEILPTYLKDVSYERAGKRQGDMTDAIVKAFQNEPRLQHLAVTSGNFPKHETTAQRFIDLMRAVRDRGVAVPGDVLATLMPPKRRDLIDELRDAGYTKIYFSLEVFERRLFEVICPGKAADGYDEILSSLNYALQSFGRGNVFSNFVYGLQGISPTLAPASYDPLRENQACELATVQLLNEGIIPVFTIYHFAGHNPIGHIDLEHNATADFFLWLGRQLRNSPLIHEQQSTVLFGRTSLANTLYNDALALA